MAWSQRRRAEFFSAWVVPYHPKFTAGLKGRYLEKRYGDEALIGGMTVQANA